jgi:hypothetical protein
VELYLHFPNKPSRRGSQLKHRDNFTFTFNLKRRNDFEDLDVDGTIILKWISGK